MSTLGEELVEVAKREDGLARVRQLLDMGVDVNSNDGNWTALLAASHYGRAEAVDLLLERGANVNALSEGSEGSEGEDTALISACINGHLAILKKLVAAKASLTVRGQSSWGPLLIASLYGHLECCEYLLSLGADLMALDGFGRTPLSYFGADAYSRLSLEALDDFGRNANHRYSPEALEHTRTVMTAAWRAGPHPSQVQRRKDEAWDRRKSIMQVSAENRYRPLSHVIAVMPPVDPAAAIPAIPLDNAEQLHAHLLGQVLSNEGIHRNIVSML